MEPWARDCVYLYTALLLAALAATVGSAYAYTAYIAVPSISIRGGVLAGWSGPAAAVWVSGRLYTLTVQGYESVATAAWRQDGSVLAAGYSLNLSASPESLCFVWNVTGGTVVFYADCGFLDAGPGYAAGYLLASSGRPMALLCINASCLAYQSIYASEAVEAWKSPTGAVFYAVEVESPASLALLVELAPGPVLVGAWGITGLAASGAGGYMLYAYNYTLPGYPVQAYALNASLCYELPFQAAWYAGLPAGVAYSLGGWTAGYIYGPSLRYTVSPDYTWPSGYTEGLYGFSNTSWTLLTDNPGDTAAIVRPCSLRLAPVPVSLKPVTLTPYTVQYSTGNTSLAASTTATTSQAGVYVNQTTIVQGGESGWPALLLVAILIAMLAFILLGQRRL